MYYRLNIVEVRLPLLRDRREDIPYLTAAFVRSFSQRFNKPLVGLTPGAERLLADAGWDGNVRQLRNVIERACILAETDFVGEGDLAGSMQEQPPVPAAAVVVGVSSELRSNSNPAPLVEVERDHIVRTLQQVRGNKAVAAVCSASAAVRSTGNSSGWPASADTDDVARRSIRSAGGCR